MLRPKQNNFEVVGECYVHGLGDAISILGPLPKPWIVQIDKGSNFSYHYRYFNPNTMVTTLEDPRLDPLDDWERLDTEREADDPLEFVLFRNKDHRRRNEVGSKTSPRSIESPWS